MNYLFSLLLIVLLISCRQNNRGIVLPVSHGGNEIIPVSIGTINLPEGYTRISYPNSSFAHWLRGQALKPDKAVYLYNGHLKKNQSAQYAVLDQPRSTTDLQQCADVVMRLRAEYLFAQKQFTEIQFTDLEGRDYTWKKSEDRGAFERYMATVFGWCGSASLEKQLKPVQEFNEIEPGDVLIRGGFPGHAVIVADMALNKKGEKLFLLVQGYQPAQDMHVLVNPANDALSPWYQLPVADTIYTPEWVFYKKQLRRW